MVPEQVELTLLGDRPSRVLLVLWSSQNLWRGRCWVNILRSRDRRLKKAGSLSPTPTALVSRLRKFASLGRLCGERRPHFCEVCPDPPIALISLSLSPHLPRG